MLTYRMIAANSGFSATGFHLGNLLLAVGAVLAAFSVFYLLHPNLFAAFAAAALFAVDPIHTEAVDWIAASPDLGCSLFVLLAFALFLCSRKAQPNSAQRKTTLLSIFSIVLYAAALLWKETAIVFPLLVIAYVLLLERDGAPRLRAALKASAVYWAILAAYLVLRFRVLGVLAGKNRNWDLSPSQLLITTSNLMLSYLGKLVWPFQLNAYYVFSPIRSLSDPRAIATILLGLTAVASLVYLIRRIPLAAFAALWVILTLLPVMNIHALGRNVFAERYLYLPSAGFCLLLTIVVGSLLGRLPQRLRRPVAISSVVLILSILSVFTFATIQRNHDWKNDKTLFAQTLLLSPDAPFVHNMVAVAETEDSAQSAAAEEHYRVAIALIKQQTPPDLLDLVVAYQGLASLYADRADNDHALEALAKAREIVPDDPDADSEEALILLRAGRWSEAEPLLERALAAQPENENALSSLAIVAWQYHDDRAKAVRLFLKALAAHPEPDDFSASLHNNLGSVYAELGDSSSAFDQFRQAIGISPRNPEYHINLANAFGSAKRYDEARTEAETALQLAPGDPEAQAVLKNLGVK
jgi:tetratricopeptide (TPR) repeat protein